MERKDFHPTADIFPLMQGKEFSDLVADIKAHGQRDPIWLHPDKCILDGRNRYLACMEAGIEPKYSLWNGEGSELSFVISLNHLRRHLDLSQRAMVAANIANMGEGRPKKTPQICEVKTRDEAAEMLNVGTRSLDSALKVKREGTPALIQAVESGRIPVSSAAELADKEPEFQESVVERVHTGVKLTEAIRQTNHEMKIEAPELPSGKYRVIYADPPWSYGNSGLDGYGHAERHYPTMSIEELGKVGVRDIVEDDAVLFLWVTSPMLQVCFKVIEAWGFKYKASFVWDKVKHNFGHYNSVRHEFLLVCTRGSCTPDKGKLFNSVVRVERTKTHSEKPSQFREIIDTLYTKGKRIEYFSRATAKGWDQFGNEPE